ncbi:ATP-binding protein [Sporomusa acidovorans]|uniref:histidine kinase n=1 Tax=Sporomusa acidovorans (strain ATCC 49682 / DSM 3132 / Mol) TaxID=1123286 RepID=A0ABZ3J9R6_SPOA4|nr:ATP-binding protein [Sporomusa acidovorans]OZC21758.1 Non-motile and phage-resistance protein [Sporomusa acidovorans DSM 3132]SDD57940.1 Signal transduction histidine kinase [Sporomusa acidovorans]
MVFKNSLTVKFMVGIAVITIVLMSINLLWNIRQYNSQAESEMKEKAAVIAQQLVATRAFIALKQDTINMNANGGYEFKHLNPAAVGKGIGEIFNGYSGYKFKQIRPQVRDPYNAPDNFELEAMKQLAADKNLKELWGYDEIDGKRVFRYLVPLYYDESCLSCHGKPAGVKDISGYDKEGFSAGEFAGSISVVFPMARFEAAQRTNVSSQVVFILFMVFVSIGLTYLMMEHIIIMPIRELTSKVVELGRGNLSAQVTEIQTYDEMRSLAEEFNTMASKLHELYNNLEGKVAERTALLSKANRRLLEQGNKLQAMNAKLTEADRLKSEFLAVMSHELRTPLTAIIAFAEILLAEGDTLSSLQREYLQDIFESGHQLLSQINDILNMSKIEAGLVKLNYNQVNISEVLDHLRHSISPLLSKKGLAFAVDIPADIPGIVADREKVTHIFRNLIGNAIKFTPAGGAIRITATLADDQQNLPAVVVKIQDTGIGISREDQKHIFDKFRQVDSAESREYPGSGLGLALARNLVEMHGGRIWVESEVGRGSTFTFVLPVIAKGC